jgi:hypothetical protein
MKAGRRREEGLWENLSSRVLVPKIVGVSSMA